LTFSILLRPEVDRSAWSWLPLLVGVGLAEAVERHAEVEARLKWPNDLLLGGLKLAGILAQAAEDAVVVGIGLNVLTRLAELPPGGGSLLSAGAVRTDRDPLLRAVLRSIETQYRRWAAAGGDAEACGLRAAYRSSCDTLGHQVDITLPTGGSYRGVATDVDAAGRLVVDGRTFAVGDVTHVRRSAAL
jgi:BirA family biotin operon repressor/biotin-[acetyl-CoA-carboxylase] ligase